MNKDLQGKLKKRDTKEYSDIFPRSVTDVRDEKKPIIRKLRTKSSKINEHFVYENQSADGMVVKKTVIVSLAPQTTTPWRSFDFDLTLMRMSGSVTLHSLDNRRDDDGTLVRCKLVMEDRFCDIAKGHMFAVENWGHEIAKIWYHATKEQGTFDELTYKTLPKTSESCLKLEEPPRPCTFKRYSSVAVSDIGETNKSETEKDSRNAIDTRSDSKQEDGSRKVHPTITRFYESRVATLAKTSESCSKLEEQSSACTFEQCSSVAVNELGETSRAETEKDSRLTVFTSSDSEQEEDSRHVHPTITRFYESRVANLAKTSESCSKLGEPSIASTFEQCQSVTVSDVDETSRAETENDSRLAVDTSSDSEQEEDSWKTHPTVTRFYESRVATSANTSQSCSILEEPSRTCTFEQCSSVAVSELGETSRAETEKDSRNAVDTSSDSEQEEDSWRAHPSVTSFYETVGKRKLVLDSSSSDMSSVINEHPVPDDNSLMFFNHQGSSNQTSQFASDAGSSDVIPWTLKRIKLGRKNKTKTAVLGSFVDVKHDKCSVM